MYIVTSASALTPLLIPCTSPVMSQHSVAYSSSSRIRGRRDLTHPQQNAMAYQAPHTSEHQLNRFSQYPNAYVSAAAGNRHHHQPVARPYNRRESREITSPDAYAYRGTGNHASILAPASARIPNLRPTPGITTFPCSWDGCGIPLDDDSRSGIKRHLEDFHERHVAAGSAQRCVCKWSQRGQSCQKDFSGIATVSKHIATVHLQSCKLRCTECGTWMSRPDALTRHLQASCQKPVPSA